MIEICCSHCHGSGKVPLPSKFLRTLGVIEGEMSPREVFEILMKIEQDEVGITAINNRLNDLFDLGLLTRRKVKKQWLFRRIEA